MGIVKEGRKVLFDRAADWFMDNGYLFSDKGEGRFIKDLGHWKCVIDFNFFNSGFEHFNTTVLMHSHPIEDIILRVGLPNMNLKTYLSGDDILFTIHDKENLKSYMGELSKIDLSQLEGFAKWGDMLVDYMSIKGEEFINKYSQIENLIAKINEFERMGLKNYLELFAGGIDHLFRVLIVSKFTDDSEHYKRQEYFDSLILKEKYALWHPHYLKLKEILANTKPLDCNKAI